MKKPPSARKTLLFVLIASIICVSARESRSSPAKIAGAAAYARWERSCIRDARKELPAIVASAEAAAVRYIDDDFSIGSYGDEGIAGETVGRSGGMMRMLAPSQVDSPDLKCIILVILRDDGFEETLRRVKAFRAQGNKLLVGIGREELLKKARSEGATFDAAFESHAAPHGGLLQDSKDAWIIPTDPVASMVVAWTWIGEFVSACSRHGKMPTMYQGFAVPGGMERAKRIGDAKFHEGTPEPTPSGSVGKEYLDSLEKSLDALYRGGQSRIRQVADLAIRTKRDGGTTYCFTHGHAILGHVPYPPNDPGFFRRINKSWFDQDPSISLKPGDFVFCVGFDVVFQGDQWGHFAESARKSGAKLAWSLTTYDADEIRSLPEDEPLIDQRWAFGDAVSTMKGYDIKILPTSGILAETVYWMVNAEMIR